MRVARVRCPGAGSLLPRTPNPCVTRANSTQAVALVAALPSFRQDGPQSQFQEAIAAAVLASLSNRQWGSPAGTRAPLAHLSADEGRS